MFAKRQKLPHTIIALIFSLSYLALLVIPFAILSTLSIISYCSERNFLGGYYYWLKVSALAQLGLFTSPYSYLVLQNSESINPLIRAIPIGAFLNFMFVFSLGYLFSRFVWKARKT